MNEKKVLFDKIIVLRIKYLLLFQFSLQKRLIEKFAQLSVFKMVTFCVYLNFPNHWLSVQLKQNHAENYFRKLFLPLILFYHEFISPFLHYILHFHRPLFKQTVLNENISFVNWVLNKYRLSTLIFIHFRNTFSLSLTTCKAQQSLHI